MLRKDYIVRQFEEFGKFIALVFGLKKEGKWDEIEKLINESASKYTSVDIEKVEKMSEQELLNSLSSDQLPDEKIKMLGDLLYEKGLAYTALIKPDESVNAFKKALQIYEYLKENALQVDFSLDMHFKINSIKQLLED
jgi:hypothetical protein